MAGKNFDSFGGLDIYTETVDTSDLDAFMNDEVSEVTPVDKTKTPKAATPPPPQKKKVEIPQEEEDETLEEEDEDFDILGELDKTEEEETEEKPTLKSQKKQEDTNEEGDEGTDEEPENTFNVLGRQLVDLGIFSLEEGETLDFESGEAFAERFEYEQKRKAANTIDQFLGRFGEDYKEAFQSIFVDGVSPIDYISQVVAIDDVASIDVSTENGQRAVLSKYYKTLGWDETKIDARVRKLIDYGDIETEAEDVHKILINKEEEKLAQLQEAKARENQERATKKDTFSKSVAALLNEKIAAKEFDSIPVTKDFAQQVYNDLTQEKYQTKSGERLSEFDYFLMKLNSPENYAKKVKLAMIAKMLETDPTLSKLQRKLVSKESNELFQGLKHAQKAKKASSGNTKGNTGITSFI
jgi:hypothetical protein